MDKQYKIFLDMDGVLVDFEGHFSNVISDFDTFIKKYGDENEFWDEINIRGKRFWTEMSWMRDGKQLLNFVKNNFEDISILSKPSKETSSRIGKLIWVKREIGTIPTILALDKTEHAIPNGILIDDTKKQIDGWIAAGGIGILHTDTKSTINKLNDILSS